MRQAVYTIEHNEPIARDVRFMRLSGPTDAIRQPGQFVNLKLDGLFLRRPFSIADWDASGFNIIFKIVGEGTRMLANLPVGRELDALTGLGNGFDNTLSRRPLLIGGGVGVPPLYALAKRFVERKIMPTLLLGFATAEDVLLADALSGLGCNVIVTLESEGQRVTDRLDEAAADCDQYYACGPEGMLRAIHKRCVLPGQLSLETRMACGVGLCRGCTCATQLGGKRVCVEGPVFDKEALPW
ncbi:dihydroorotate dehydrogenase B (NAD(+)), electron transfer subunit [Clostridia bacterium]|nr:dihydroorotate dehydrogenase B (NAD(+)), electron transfer subunit [Clostridia bacterium]